MTVRLDARAFPQNYPIDSFDPQQFEGVDDLYTKFWELEGQYQKNRTGLFSNPITRASGYAALIHKLLRTENGYAMQDGSAIPDSDVQLANQLFDQGYAYEVWAPKGAARYQKQECEGYRKEVELALHEVVFLPDSVSCTDSETEDDAAFSPRDRAEELALPFIEIEDYI